MGITASLMAYIGILTAIACYPLLGVFALPIGMLSAMLSDVVLSYLSNVLFKYLEEKRADQFAAQHSNATDIFAAADFFEKHQEIINATIEHTTFFTHLPSLILSGHPNGYARGAHLRKLANKLP